MSNAIGSNRESNPSGRISHLRAVPLGHVADKKSIQDVCVGAELNGEQRNEVREVQRRYDEVFTEIPGNPA